MAITGVADHSGWAVLVTVAEDGTCIDRRRVDLIDPGLPIHPHHHEGQGLPLDQAIALVERVRASASRRAAEAMDSLMRDVPGVVGIAIRQYAPLPPTVAERITNYRAQNYADSAMFRDALAAAAAARGCFVEWYDRNALDLSDARLHEPERRLGPPWQKDHRMAMAAALSVYSTASDRNVLDGEVR